MHPSSPAKGFVVISAFASFACDLTSQDDKPREPTILERHVDFVGGAKAIAEAGDFVMEGRVDTGRDTLALRVSVRRKPFALRQEIRTLEPGSPALVRITDGRYAWQLDASGKAEVLPPLAARVLIEAAFLDGLLYLDPSPRMRPVVGGIETLLGVAQLPGGLGAPGKLREVQFAPAGSAVSFRFDESDGALRAVVTTTIPPARELRLGDWKQHFGLRWPMLRRELVSGEAATITLEKVECRVSLEPELFAGCPAPVLPERLRVGELWGLPDSIPEAMQFAVPRVDLGNGVEAVALFDTGANQLFVSPATALRARLPYLASGQTQGTHGPADTTHLWLDRLQLGSFVDRQLRAHATSLPPMTALSVEHQPALILGTPIAIERSPVLDLRDGSLWLRGAQVVPLGDGEADRAAPILVPFRRDPSTELPMVDVNVGDASIEAMFDTGQGPVLMLTAKALARLSLPVDRASWAARGGIALPMQGAGGRTGEQLLVRLPSVRLGAVKWLEPYALLSLDGRNSQFDAILGGGALWHFARVGIDARRNLVELDPRDGVARVGDLVVLPRSASFAGMVPVPAAQGAVGEDSMPIVHAVFPGTIAAAAGVEPGDRIRAIDGKKCAGLAPRAFNERLWIRDSPVRLEVVRKDGTAMLLQLMPANTRR